MIRGHGHVETVEGDQPDATNPEDWFRTLARLRPLCDDRDYAYENQIARYLLSLISWLFVSVQSFIDE